MNDQKIAPTKAFPKAEAEQIRRNILAVGDAAKKLLNSGLNRRAIKVLIHDATNVPMGDVERVLVAARDLPKLYCVPEVTAK